VLDNLDGWKLGALVLLGIFLFGPERLPRFVADALRMVRVVRRLGRDAVDMASREVGADLTLEDLHPKTFLRKHLLNDDEQARLLAPLTDAVRHAQHLAADAKDTAESAVSRVAEPRLGDTKPVDPDAT
jgi:sec-independent protein translocase protein TatB